MTKWSELERHQKWAFAAFIVVVLIIIIMAWYGYYTGAWEQPPQPT